MGRRAVSAAVCGEEDAIACEGFDVVMLCRSRTSRRCMGGRTVMSSDTHGAKQNQNMLARKLEASVCVLIPNAACA